MQGATQTNEINGVERVLIAGVLFYNAMVFCLPVPSSEDIAALYPWWGNRIAIGNVQLAELFFLTWLALFGARFVPRVLLNRGIPTRQAAYCLILLAVWCGLISLSAPLFWLDLGRTLRLLLNAALLLAVVRWARWTGDFPLRLVILGFLGGTIINLVLSFRFPLIVFETMRLSGQNTPGVAMGIGIHLCAWQFFRANRRTNQVLALCAAVVLAFGCGISYSRIGWFAGGLGLIAWGYVLIAARPRARSDKLRLRKMRRVWLPVLAVGVSALLVSAPARENMEWIQTLVTQKFTSDANAQRSNAQRGSYFIGVTEILVEHPLGVGYSGFFDAMTATAIYRSGDVVTETDYEANPHAAFLHYASAGGIPGALMAFSLFAMLLNSLRVGLLSAMGRPGQILFMLIAPPFLLIGLTVPYLFNSTILIVPAAIAAGWGWTRRIELASTAPPTVDHSNAKKTLRSTQPSPALP